MFQKRIIELFIFVVYWLVLVPMAHTYAKEWKWLTLDLNNVSDVISKYAVFMVVMIFVYMVIYRIILWIYMKCKIIDIQTLNNLKKLHSQEDLSPNKSVITLDQVYQALSTMDLQGELNRSKSAMTLPQLYQALDSHQVGGDFVRSKSAMTLDQVYQALATRDEIDGKPLKLKSKAKALSAVNSPLAQHRQKFEARTNNAYIADTLPTLKKLKQMQYDVEKANSLQNLNQSQTVVTLDQVYQALSTMDERQQTKRQHLKALKPNLSALSSPMPQRKFQPKHNSGFVADTLPTIHGTTIKDYLIKKPAPLPPTTAATPKRTNNAPYPDIIAISKPVTPIYGARKQLVLPPLPTQHQKATQQ